MNAAVIPESIAQLQLQLDQIRSTQPRGKKLPDSVWQAAVELAREHGVYSVAHHLRLDWRHAVFHHQHKLARLRAVREGPYVGSDGHRHWWDQARRRRLALRRCPIDASTRSLRQQRSFRCQRSIRLSPACGAQSCERSSSG
jgi:hypothetical protein